MYKLLFLSLLFQCLYVQAQENSTVIKGSIKGPFTWKSKLYAGTERNYWLYIPQQYNAEKPACLMVVQDGLSRANGWRLPAVLDSLIALNAIPVMIGVFIDPGIVPASDTGNYPRYNRSFEYDALGDRYARFLMEEILPEVSRSYNLSTDPNDRSIAGASSGAICAFNVAWERPNAFRRVFSSIGTYVGLRGAHESPTLIRKTEPKPLRVFLQDGTRDNNIYAGDWWVANQDMLSALKWAGYEVSHAWGEGGGHDSKHTINILADALLWLWKDYPKVVHIHPDSVTRFNPLVKEETWQEINLNGLEASHLAVDDAGYLFFTAGQFVYKYDGRSAILFTKLKGSPGGISFHNDGRLYVSDPAAKKIVAIDKKGIPQEAISNVNANFVTVSNNGIYFSETTKSRIGFYSFNHKALQYVPVPGNPTGLAISAEQTFMSAGIGNGVFGYSFKISGDGKLIDGQDYIHYHLPYGATVPGVTAMIIDTANWLYSATRSGIQVTDQLGRVNLIISGPANDISDMKMGGANFNSLYVIANRKLYRRKLNTKGTESWFPAVKPSKPRL